MADAVLKLGIGLESRGIQVSVNRNPVRVGEQVQLTFTLKNVSGRVDGPKSRTQVAFGPSTSNSTSIYNGKRTSESGLYVYLSSGVQNQCSNTRI